MGVTGGLIALVAALAVASALGLVLRRRAGRFRAGRARPPASGALGGAVTLTEADLGGPLGEQATLVQFSTPFCAPCRPTRQILGQVAGMVDGVSHIEVDAAERLDLARRLRAEGPRGVADRQDGGVRHLERGIPHEGAQARGVRWIAPS